LKTSESRLATPRRGFPGGFRRPGKGGKFFRDPHGRGGGGGGGGGGDPPRSRFRFRRAGHPETQGGG